MKLRYLLAFACLFCALDLLCQLPAGSRGSGSTASPAPTVWNLTTTTASYSPSPFPADVRVCCGVEWKWLEPTTQGTYVWKSLDAWITLNHAHSGSKLIYTFLPVPPWLTSGANGTYPPTDLGVTTTTCSGIDGSTANVYDCAYKQFVTAFMRHVCGGLSAAPGSPLVGTCRVRKFEAWNEFNANNYWSGTDAQLAVMGNDMSTIVHKYCGDCVVMLGSTSAGGDGYRPNGEPVHYDTALADVATKWAAIPGASLWDAISWHPYPSRTDVTNVPVTSLISYDSATCTSGNTPNVHCYVPISQQVTHLRAALAGITGTNVPIYATEGGWGLTANICDTTCDTTDATHGANTIMLRKAFISQWMIVLQEQGVTGAMWYAPHDQGWGSMIGTGVAEGRFPIIPTSYNVVSAWNQTAAWLASGTVTLNSLASATVTGGKVWTVSMTISGAPAKLAWFDGYLATTSYATTFTTQTNLSGTSSAITAGTVTLDQTPRLLQ